MNHPSFFALDLHALGRAPQHDAHVEQCDRCRAHVQRVMAARAPALPEPKRAVSWQWAFALVPVAAAIIFFAVPRAAEVRAKGDPAVHLLLKTGEWGGAPLQPGEEFRLRVDADDFAHVAVIANGDTILYRGAPGLLPKAWAIEDPKSDRLQVVLTHEPCDDARLLDLARRNVREADAWVLALELGR
jgi:hypothetical protein